MQLSVVTLLASLTLVASAADVALGARCDPAGSDAASIAAARAAVDAACDCSAAATHGEYVRCASAVLKELPGGLPKQCKGTVKKCYAKSTCGKPGFVTCCVSKGGEIKCKTQKDADTCVDKGGVTGSATSCCDACPQSTVTTTSTSTTTTTLLPACQRLEFTTDAPVGVCGRINDAVDGTGADLVPFGGSAAGLACGTLYIGGGASVQPPSPTPDGATTVYRVTDCDDSAALMLGPAPATDTGNMTQCSAPGCFFGPPLPIPNEGAAAVSTCVVNRIANTPLVSGTLNAATGETLLVLPLRVSAFVTGDLNGPEPGIQPCPLCIGGTCDRGPNAGGSCTTTSSAGTTHDCPPPGSSLPAFGVDLAPLVTGEIQFADPAGSFCVPIPGQATLGCFGTGVGTCKFIEATGVPGGDLQPGAPRATTLASVYCIPGSGSPLVDTVANLPGPGAVTLVGDAQLGPP
jgi:hypothetical protein